MKLFMTANIFAAFYMALSYTLLYLILVTSHEVSWEGTVIALDISEILTSKGPADLLKFT